MTNSFTTKIYRSAKTLSYIAIGFFVSLVLCNFLFFIFSFGQVLFSDSQIEVSKGHYIPTLLGLIGVVSLFEILLRIGTIIFLLIWEYRAFNNLPALKATNLEFSPGWAIGWWFIPFANLVKPYQVMSELWNASDSDFDPKASFLSNRIGSPKIIGCWWGIWILSNISGRVSNTMGNAQSQYFPVALAITSILSGIAAILIIIIIKNITQQQELRFQKLGEFDEFVTPPPPPKFD